MLSTKFNFEDVEDINNKINTVSCSAAQEVIGKSKGVELKRLYHGGQKN